MTLGIASPSTMKMDPREVKYDFHVHKASGLEHRGMTYRRPATTFRNISLHGPKDYHCVLEVRRNRPRDREGYIRYDFLLVIE